MFFKIIMLDISKSAEGHFLIAISENIDKAFDKAVIFICKHDKNGAMGFVINQPLENLELCDLIQQVGDVSIEIGNSLKNNPQVHWGGPIEMNRGFVLHSLDYNDIVNTLVVGNSYGVTASVDILKAIFTGSGPEEHFIAIGYANWESGQLESELESNTWLVVPASKEIIFDTRSNQKWKKALSALGIRSERIVIDQGSA